MKKKQQRFPVTVSEQGISAKIRRFSQNKGGKTYETFIVEYFLLGKRKQQWRSSFGEAETAALDACRTIAQGQQSSLPLVNGERLEYLRAMEALLGTGIRLDTAATEFANALKILGGKASLTEACREWVKRNSIVLPQISVGDASQKIQSEAITDGKSKLRQKQLYNVLERLSRSFSVSVQSVTPNLVSAYLASLPLSERSKRNHRDVIGFFNRWLILRGYLPKDTNWLEGVQKYSARKFGEIGIYTPEEMKLILEKADRRLVPFLAIGAFAGLRHAEIARLDWGEIEIADGAKDSFIEIRADKAKTQTRRLVPISDNLKAWLLPHRKTTGKVCPFENVSKQLLKMAGETGMAWKKNALRHSCISYRIAESADVPRVSDESGNSVHVIRTNYLRRVRPSAAAEWFNILPTTNHN